MAPRISTKNPAPVQALESHLRGEETRSGRIIVRIVRCSTRVLDKDNLHGCVKGLVDCLRYSELIPDDTEEDIDLRVTQFKVHSCKETGTHIEIEYQ